jgi:hypothetical protein
LARNKQVAHEIKTRWPQCVSLYKASKENLIRRPWNHTKMKDYWDIDSTNWHYECRRICFF